MNIKINTAEYFLDQLLKAISEKDYSAVHTNSNALERTLDEIVEDARECSKRMAVIRDKLKKMSDSIKEEQKNELL